MRGGKRRTVERKVYPGYIMAQIQTDDDGKVPPELVKLESPRTASMDFSRALGRIRPLWPAVATRIFAGDAEHRIAGTQTRLKVPWTSNKSPLDTARTSHWSLPPLTS